MQVPARTRKHLKRLLGQQFWLFGCDIRRPEGNLLMELGFDKCKAPLPAAKATSRYTWQGAHAPVVMLWGFGLLWSDASLGDVFLSRHAFAPLYRPPGLALPDAWEPRAIDGLVRPDDAAATQRCQHLVLNALAWCGAYERFVVTECGPAYRDAAISAWKWPCGCAATLADAWDLACDDLAARFAISGTGLVVPPTPQVAPGRPLLAS